MLRRAGRIARHDDPPAERSPAEKRRAPLWVAKNVERRIIADCQQLYLCRWRRRRIYYIESHGAKSLSRRIDRDRSAHFDSYDLKEKDQSTGLSTAPAGLLADAVARYRTSPKIVARIQHGRVIRSSVCTSLNALTSLRSTVLTPDFSRVIELIRST
jgi:hypothetical protein